MAASSYDAALARLLEHEGGYSNHPSDPGGPTNFGITIHDYRKYVNPGATAAEVRGMSVVTAKRIYREKYWNVQRCDELPAGVDYATFDYGVNSGVGRSAKVLQRLVGLTGADVDGEIGDRTLARAHARDPKVLVAAICDERLAFLERLRTWPTFGNGWGRRVSEVRAYSLVLAGAAQGVTPNVVVIVVGKTPPWFARQTALMGLYEFRGGADNPAILAMARACGGNIARTYKHDATPWCAMDANYCLISGGQPGNDSLLALEFRKYGVPIDGPAVGAIATKTRQGGGHVFFVAGRDKRGAIVGRGGNQGDMVCDELFDPAVLRYNWPKNYPLPEQRGFAALPVINPTPKVRKEFAALPPVTDLASSGTPSGKGAVPAPAGTKKIIQTGVPAGGAGVGAALWDWIAANPFEAAAIGLVGGTIVIGGGVYLVNRWHRARQEAPTPGLVPVFAPSGASTGEPVAA